MPRPARERAGIFVELAPAVVEAIKHEAANRGRPVWWVVETAVRSGLPLLPPNEQEEMDLAV